MAAALISGGSTIAAVLQAKSAKQSAKVAKADLAESRKQTRAAKKAASAAEQQVAEAHRQNEIAERQLRVAQEEIEAGRRRYQQEQSARHVATVHKVLLAAGDLRDELREDARAVIEHQHRPDSMFWVGPPLMMFGRAESAWDAAVNKIRVDKPPASDLTAAIDAYDKYVRSAVQAVGDGRGKAEERQLSRSAEEALVVLINRRDDEFVALKRACDEFFADNGVNPGDLAAN